MWKFGKFWSGRGVNFGGRFWKIQRGWGLIWQIPSVGLVWNHTLYYSTHLLIIETWESILGTCRGGWKGVYKSTDPLWFINQICPSSFTLNWKSGQKYFNYMQSPKSIPKKLINLQSATIAGSGNLLKSRFEFKIWAKIFQNQQIRLPIHPPPCNSTIEDQVLSLKDWDTSDCQLTFKRYCVMWNGYHFFVNRMYAKGGPFLPQVVYNRLRGWTSGRSLLVQNFVYQL